MNKIWFHISGPDHEDIHNERERVKDVLQLEEECFHIWNISHVGIVGVGVLKIRNLTKWNAEILQQGLVERIRQIYGRI